MPDRHLSVLSLVKMPRAFSLLATLLVLLSLLGGITLYREVLDRSKRPRRALKNQIAQTLKANAESLKFIENKGQWPADVLYALESATGVVWIRKDDIFFRAVRRMDEGGEGVEPNYHAHNWKMTLAGKNRHFKVRQGEPQKTIYNYFIDNDHMTAGVRSFKEVTLEGIYPGIDVRFYSGDKEQIEYDFIVAPGADYRQIKMDFEGQDFLRTGDDNTLEIGLSFDTIKTTLPEVYQVRDGVKVAVEMAFSVDGNRAGFEAASPIDTTLALVIDPTLLWGTYFEDTAGQNFDGYAYGGKSNACGEVYVGGQVNMQIDATYTTSTGLNPTFPGGSAAAVIYKFNSTGTDVLNFTYYGLTGATSLQGSTFLDIDLFPDGRVIAVGRTQGTVPVTGTAYQGVKGTTLNAGDVTGVIAVFDANLAGLLYSSYLGSADPDDDPPDMVRSVVTAGNNAYYVGGSIEGAPQIATFVDAGRPDTTTAGLEGYIARFSGATYNVRDWATYVGGAEIDHVFSLAITPDGTKLVFAGWVDDVGDTNGYATFPALVNAVDSARNSDECFVGWIASVTTPPTAFGLLSFIGGSIDGVDASLDDDARPTVATDNVNLFVAFSSQSDDVPGELTAASPALFNVVLSKIDLAGSTGTAPTVVSQYRGGDANDTAGGVVLTTAGEVLLFGSTEDSATDYPVSNSTPPSAFFDGTHAAGIDIVLNFFTASDTLPTTFSGFVGGGFNDYLGDTGIVQGGGHYDYNPTTGVVTLATTVHSILPASVVPGPPGTSFDTTKNAPGESVNADSHLIIKFATEVIDYGDALMSYDGALATAARHAVGELSGATAVIPYSRLGVIVDVDPTAQWSFLSQGDDNNATTNPCAPGGDDEDGVTFPAIVACALPGSFVPTVSYFKNTNPATATVTIQGWIDVNGNGTFEDNAVEFRTGTAAVNNVQTSVAFTALGGGPSAWVLSGGTPVNGGFRARFRITTDTTGMVAPLSRGLAPGFGEVEDYFIPVQMDFGDAPNTYGTLAIGNSARHPVDPNLHIGVANDIECDGFPTIGATGDDTNVSDDEDGLAGLSIHISATNVTLMIPVVNTTPTLAAARLCGWIDFNVNGTFEVSEGRCSAPIPGGTSGPATLVWNPLPALTPGNTYMRLRLSTDLTLTTSAFIGPLNDGEIEDIPVVISNSTALTLNSFKAYQIGESVYLNWDTGYEVDNLGFNLYRESGGRRHLVSRSLIAGSGLIVGKGVRLQAGLSYAWKDDEAGSAPGALYWLEEVDLNGAVIMHGPFGVESGQLLPVQKRRFLTAQTRAATLKEVVNRLGTTGGTRPIEPRADVALSNAAAATSFQIPARSVDLAGQAAIKIGVDGAGWHRVTQPELLAAGLSKLADPRLLQLYVDDKQVPVRVTGEEDGSFDAGDTVEFFGVGLDTPSTDKRVYWLRATREPGMRLRPLSPAAGAPAAPSFTTTVERKEKVVYVSAVLNGAGENFFGRPIASSIPTVTQTLQAPNLFAEASGAASIDVALQGVSVHPHSIKVTVNGLNLGTVDFEGREHVVKTFHFANSQLVSGDNQVVLEKASAEADLILIDYLRLTYQHAWKADANALLMTAYSGEQVSVGGFTSNNVRILDVTNPDSVTELNVVVAGEQGSFTATAAITEGAAARTLYAFTSDVVRAPESVELNKASNWKSTRGRADFLVVGHSTLLPAIQPLVDLRRSQGLSVAVIDIQDIYDEFSFGHKSPNAIVDFVRFASIDRLKRPRALLLLGKASYDPRTYLGGEDRDLVPTRFVDTFNMECAVDDAFADFNGDGIPELAVGRLPAMTVEEAAVMVGKIVAYETSPPSNRVALIADVNDTYSFDSFNNQLLGVIPQGIQVDTISVTQLGAGEAKVRVLEAANRSNRIVNFAGHGSIDVWRGNLMTASDAAGLQKVNQVSLYVMMTCLNGYFISPLIESLSETLLKSPGGAVATWASSGTTVPEGQQVMNVAAFVQLLGAQNSTIGEAARAAKAAVADPDVRRTWNLLGDPMMRLK